VEHLSIDDAKKAYNQAWSAWCLTTDEGDKHRLEQVMDGLQPQIANGPTDPPGVWHEFIDTLPGYREFWARWHDESLERLRSARRRPGL
jgi:hypothetical protein